MSDPQWEHEIPVCPLCGGMVRAEILHQNNPDDPERGPWRCDLHGEVTPVWEWEEDEEDEP